MKNNNNRKNNAVKLTLLIVSLIAMAMVIIMLLIWYKNVNARVDILTLSNSTLSEETTETNALTESVASTETSTGSETTTKVESIVSTEITTEAPNETPTPHTPNKAITPVKASEDGQIVICIDAGHGYDDPGCTSKLLTGYESDITLSLAKTLKAELEALDPNVTVILTHDGATYPSAQSIRDLAKQYDIEYDSGRIVNNNIFSAYERAIYSLALHAETTIDFFISIHINSIEGYPEISQYELYYDADNPYVPLLQTFSDSLTQKLDNETLTAAMSGEDSYTVTYYATFPSILIEAGYATNASDAANLNSTTWRQQFCETIAGEILAVLK